MTPQAIAELKCLSEKIARELVFAEADKDLGLLPVNSLLGQIEDLLAQPNWPEPLARATRMARCWVDDILGSTGTFSERSLKRLGEWVTWLQAGVQSCENQSAPAPIPSDWESAKIEVGSPEAAAPQILADPSEPALLLNLEQDRELLREFINESQEHLQNIEQGVLVLEENPADAETLNSIFRAFHTFKGGAGFLNLEAIQKLAHELESVLDLARRQKLAITPEIINLILAGGDALRRFIAEIEARLSGSQPDGPIVVPTICLLGRIREVLARGGEACIQESITPVRLEGSAPQSPVAADSGTAIAKAVTATVLKTESETPGKPRMMASGTAIKVDTLKLDSLVDLVGELVITQSLILQNRNLNTTRDGQLTRDLAQLGQISKGLQRTAMIEQSNHFLVCCQEQTGQMLELLRNYSDRVEQLLRVETELQRTMMPLKFVQILFKSECAPLGSDIQQMFSSLTLEIEGLHTRVREIFGTKFNQLEQTRRTIAQVVAQLERQVCALRQITTTHKARIESSLETLKKETISGQERHRRLGRLSKELAREVEAIVMGLQFQDILNQKLQHVSEALPQIEAKYAELSAVSNATAARKPLQFLHQSCRLKAGQIGAAREELAKAQEAIHSGVQSALAHLTKMDSRCESVDEFKDLTTSFDGMAQVLVETIGEVRKLVATTVANSAEAFDMLRPLGSLASDLTVIVRGMSAQIHLIGLNAQVQTARAAEDPRGAGLEVLSARTSEISNETNRISEQAAAQLDALAAGLAESVRALGQLRADGLEQETVLNQQGSMEEQHLCAFRSTAMETLRAIGGSLHDIQEQARRTLAAVDFNQFCQVTLPALQAPLLAIADTAQKALQAQGQGIAQTSLVEGFKRHYTMSSERAVFASVVPASFSSCPPAPGVDSSAGSDIQSSTGLPAGVESEPSLGGNPTADATLPADTAASAGNSGLGANVELF